MLLDAEEADLYDITIETDTEVSQFNDQFKVAAEKSGTVFNLKVESKVIESEGFPSDPKSMIQMFLDIRFRDKVTDGRVGIISIKLNGYEQCVFRFKEVISVKSFTLPPDVRLEVPPSPPPLISPPQVTTLPPTPTSTALAPQETSETFEESLTSTTDDNNNDTEDISGDIFVDEDLTESSGIEVPASPPPLISPPPQINRAWNKDGLKTIIITVVSAIAGVVMIISLVACVFCRRNSSDEGNQKNKLRSSGNHEPIIIHQENIQNLRNSFIYDD